jgi:hypothetical protein
MILCAVSVLVVSQSSSEIPERLINNPVYQSAGFPTRRPLSTHIAGFSALNLRSYSLHNLAQHNLHVFYINSLRSLARQLSDLYDVKSLAKNHTNNLYVDVGKRPRTHYKYVIKHVKIKFE